MSGADGSGRRAVEGSDGRDVAGETAGKGEDSLPNNSRALPEISRKAPGYSMPKNSRAGIERKIGWIEFPKSGTKNPKRYAMRRHWKRENGEWKKVSIGRALDLFPDGLTEDEYHEFKEKQRRAREARKRSNDAG